MKTIAIYETETSQPEYREVPTVHAHKLGQNGGFYKVQIIDDFGIIEVEYK